MRNFTCCMICSLFACPFLSCRNICCILFHGNSFQTNHPICSMHMDCSKLWHSLLFACRYKGLMMDPCMVLLSIPFPDHLVMSHGLNVNCIQIMIQMCLCVAFCDKPHENQVCGPFRNCGSMLLRSPRDFLNVIAASSPSVV